jgi:CRP-like cAMP-binding protein
MLFEEGSLGSALYIVHSGNLRAVALIDAATNAPLSPQDKEKSRRLNGEGKSASSPNGTSSPGGSVLSSGLSSVIEKTLHEFHAGDVFGEISLIMDIPRTAGIAATTEAICFELQRDSFQKFVKLVPQHLELSNMVKARTAEHFRKYKVPFFEAIPDSKYASLAALCKIEQIPPRQIIFKEGDKGKSKRAARTSSSGGSSSGSALLIVRCPLCVVVCRQCILYHRSRRVSRHCHQERRHRHGSRDRVVPHGSRQIFRRNRSRSGHAAHGDGGDHHAMRHS